MRSFFTFFTLLAVSLAVQAQQPSGTPCYYTCPGQDDAGFALGPGSQYDQDSNGVLFCSYPAFPNEPADDFWCDYDDVRVLTPINLWNLCRSYDSFFRV
jgi:hypothetical protein